MSYITVEEVKGSFEGSILDDIKGLKKHLDDNFSASNSVLVSNLIKETEVIIKEAASSSINYYDRHLVFTKLTKTWMDLWRHYNHLLEAIDLGKAVNQLTDHFSAGSYLYLGLSLINEGRTGDYHKDLERITSGFFWLSETVDVFMDFFTDGEIQAIYDSAKSAINSSIRTPWDYFEDGSNISRLTTNLRAYSSLIILRINERQSETLPDIGIYAGSSKLDQSDEVPTTYAWEKIDGTFANSPLYDDAARLGQEYRQTYVSSSSEHSEV